MSFSSRRFARLHLWATKMHPKASLSHPMAPALRPNAFPWHPNVLPLHPWATSPHPRGVPKHPYGAPIQHHGVLRTCKQPIWNSARALRSRKEHLWPPRCSSAHVPLEDRGTRAGGNYTFHSASHLYLLASDSPLDIRLVSYT